MITRAWIAFLRRTLPKHRIRIESPDPGITAALHSTSESPVQSTDTLWRLMRQSFHPGAEPKQQLETATRFVRHGGTPNIDLGISQLNHVKTMHLVGGGYMNSIWPENCALPVVIGMFPASILKVATGAGLEPQKAETQALLEKGFRAFSRVTVRDESSAKLYGKHVQFGVDDLFLGFNPEIRNSVFPARAVDEESPNYMLLLQRDFSPSDPSRQQLLDIALDELIANGWDSRQTLGVVEAMPGLDQDGWLIPALADRGIPTHFCPFYDVWENGFPASRQQFWVTTRFHPHMYLASRGIRGTAIALNEYYVTKHQSLTRLGTGWKLMNLDGQTIVPANPEADFPAQATKLARTKWDEAKRIYSSRRVA